MPQKDKFFEKDSPQNDSDTNPIFIPSESFIEGYLKSSKSIKLECNFTGTIFTSKKLIIESSATMKGDAICKNLVWMERWKEIFFVAVM